MKRENGYDLLFLAAVSALVVIGFATTVDIVVTSPWIRRMDTADFWLGKMMIGKQAMMVIMGTLLFSIMQCVESDFKKFYSRFEFWLIPAVCLPLLPLFFQDYAAHRNGAARWFGFHPFWIHTGFWSCVCYLISCAIVTAGEEKLNWLKSAYLIACTCIMGFVLLTHDLPMLLILFLIVSSFLWLNNRKIAAITFICVSCSLFCGYLILKSGYELPRIMAFYNLSDPWGLSYQILEARKCFKMGGLFGSAASCMPPQSLQMPFAVFASKYGLGGVMFYLVIQGMFFVFGYRAVLLVQDKTKALILKGGLYMLAFYSIAGMAATTNLLPVFYPAPFGYGYGLLLFSFVVSGVLFRILRETRQVVQGNAVYASMLRQKPVICYLGMLIVITSRCAYLMLLENKLC